MTTQMRAFRVALSSIDLVGYRFRDVNVVASITMPTAFSPLILVANPWVMDIIRKLCEESGSFILGHRGLFRKILGLLEQ